MTLNLDSPCITVDAAPPVEAVDVPALLANVALVRGVLAAEPCDCTPYTDSNGDFDGYDLCVRCSLLGHLEWPTR